MDIGSLEIHEQHSKDIGQINTHKNEPLQAQHYFSNQTRPSIASQDHKLAVGPRQVSLNPSALKDRPEVADAGGLQTMKKSLSNTCSHLNFNVASPQSNNFAGNSIFKGQATGNQAFQGFQKERKKMLSSSRSIQSLIPNQLRETHLLNHRNNMRLGSTQKNSELNGTQGPLQNREQIQLTGPAELKLGRADLTQLSLMKLNYKLKMVDLSNNKIRSLPSELLLLTNLVSLNIKGNVLEALPEDVGSRGDKLRKGFVGAPNIRLANTMSWSNLSNLQDLIVSENKLRRLPDNIGSCSNLRNLQIIGNQLCEIPASFANLTSLESLNFEWFMYLDPPQQ